MHTDDAHSPPGNSRLVIVLRDPRAGVQDTGASTQSLVFHTGTVYEAKVPVCVTASDGAGRPNQVWYDGADDGIVNMGRWMFTYEFLQGFLDQFSWSDCSFHGYLHAALRGYVLSLSGEDTESSLGTQLRQYETAMRPHNRNKASKRLYAAFVDAVFDFITLQASQWDLFVGDGARWSGWCVARMSTGRPKRPGARVCCSILTVCPRCAAC